MKLILIIALIFPMVTYSQNWKDLQKAAKKVNKELKKTSKQVKEFSESDAAAALNCEVGAIVKSLLLRTDDSFILCLVSGDKRCSLNKIKKMINKKDVSMANADQVKSQTGFSIGGVSPVAHLEKIKILVDSSLSRYENVYAAAGHPNSIFKITYKQLIKLTEGKEEDIV